ASETARTSAVAVNPGLRVRTRALATSRPLRTKTAVIACELMVSLAGHITVQGELEDVPTFRPSTKKSTTSPARAPSTDASRGVSPAGRSATPGETICMLGASLGGGFWVGRRAATIRTPAPAIADRRDFTVPPRCLRRG